MSEHTSQLERLYELLADDATIGLAETEHAELMRLLADHPELDAESFHWAAAAIDLPEIMADREPVPPSLRQRIETTAIEHLAARRGLSVTATRPAVAPPAPAPAPATQATATWSWLPWLAAAACLVLAVLAWLPRPTEAEAPSLTALRDELLAEPTTGRWSWTQDGLAGEIVWNAARQEGVLEVAGLPVNDPASMQYQLWIFDDALKDYSDNVAVDGGVFDIDPETGVALVPIRAPITVTRPSLFAITSEPPGGVVKHNPQRDPERYKIVATAPVT